MGGKAVMDVEQKRINELAENLRRVNEEIAEAAQDYSQVRHADSAMPRLTVVTKFFPASDVQGLYSLGVRYVGENRDQEASAKEAELKHSTDEEDPLLWAYIGQLQSNKAKSVVKYAAEVQSVDRVSLVNALTKAYSHQLKRWENGEMDAPAAAVWGGLRCFVQVNLDDSMSADSHRGGARVDDVARIADEIVSDRNLTCAGVMAVAPRGMDPHRAFEKLFTISQKLQEIHPGATEISAGMSGDMRAAIAWGSTNVRIGSHIMGARSAI